MKVVVVIPTITGREDHYARCRAAYERTSQKAEIVTVLDRRNWPSACNYGTEVAVYLGADVIHYTADDLEPHDGWLEAALTTIEEGRSPGCVLFQPDGKRWASEEAEGEGQVGFPRIPTLTAEQARAIGPWPEIDYYADCWLGPKLLGLGVECWKARGYRFTHYWAKVGRLDDEERLRVAWEQYTEELAKI